MQINKSRRKENVIVGIIVTVGLRKNSHRPQNKLVNFARPACSPVFTQASPNHALVRDLDRCSENIRKGEI